MTSLSGIQYEGRENNFERDFYSTIEAMVAAASNPRNFPPMFIAMCAETGGVYLYNKNNEAIEGLGKWRVLNLNNNQSGGDSGNTGGGSGGSGPSNPSGETFTAYYGFLNGSLETTSNITDEGIEVTAATVSALATKTITSKSTTNKYVAGQAEEDAEGQSFLVYAYPASLGELTTYNFGMGTNAIEKGFTKFDIEIEGVAYYAYAQTKGSAPDVGRTVSYTFA